MMPPFFFLPVLEQEKKLSENLSVAVAIYGAKNVSFSFFYKSIFLVLTELLRLIERIKMTSSGESE